MRLTQAGSGRLILLVISGLFAVSMLVSSALMVRADREAIVHEAQRNDTVLTQMVEEHARRAFDMSKAALLELADAVMASGKPEVTPEVVVRMNFWIKNTPQIYAFWLIDAVGKVAVTTQQVETSGFDFSDREYFKAHRDGHVFHVGRMTRGRIDNVWFYSLSQRLADRDGNFAGVLVASMPTDYFEALYKELGLDPTDNIGIFRPDGAIVARRLTNWANEVGPSIAGHPLFAEFSSNPTWGVYEGASPVDHIKRLGAYRAVKGWPLIVAAATDEDKLMAPWRQRTLSIAAYCAAMLGALAFLTWWGYRRVSGEAQAMADLRRSQDALKAAKVEAERASLAKSKFLAAASHDLRQPVQALTLLLEVMKAHANAPPVARAVAMMGGALEGLSRLLASILDISRIDAGVVAPQMQSIDIDGLVHRLGEEYASLCREKGLQLRFRSKPGLHVRTDPVLLERILRNLVDNAIQYTSRGGVLIGVRQRNDRLRIDIADSGIGIPPDQIANIFEEFYQVGNPARDHKQGLGLGLAIVSRLARLLGAEVRVRSSEGRGTCFTVIVPVGAATLGKSSVFATTEVISEARVMVIEDNPKVRTGLELLLESWSCKVVSVASGERALEVGESDGWRFDAIIADHRLGAGLSGTETAVEIARRAGRPIPTLIVTGDTAPERIEEIHASGFEMMHKPVMPGELAHRMAHLLRGRTRGGAQWPTGTQQSANAKQPAAVQ
jgi:signal transduction histidine kinase